MSADVRENSAKFCSQKNIRAAAKSKKKLTLFCKRMKKDRNKATTQNNFVHVGNVKLYETKHNT